MDTNKQQLLDSFVRNPTTYTIPVRDGAMLPKELKGEKELSFTIKPPTMHVLTLAASEMASVPEKLLSGEEMDLDEALKYQGHIARLLSIFFYERADYPQWCPEFIRLNLSTVELLNIMQETAVKCSPGFFLSCFQIAAQSNPMMTIGRTMTQDSTPTGS